MRIATFALLLLCSSFALADSCQVILRIQTNDPIYSGDGEVKLCTNNLNQISKLIVVKPVQNPLVRDLDSDQADERNPIIQITLDQINTMRTDFPILTPSRMGIQAIAALLEVPRIMIDKNKGGEVILKVLRSKVMGTYHRFQLNLIRVGGGWKAYLVQNGTKTPLNHAYFYTGLSGIKKVDFY